MSYGGSGGLRQMIGISTCREQARWGCWNAPAVLLPARRPARTVAFSARWWARRGNRAGDAEGGALWAGTGGP
jgi:hypothetical protein